MKNNVFDRLKKELEKYKEYLKTLNLGDKEGD